MMALDPATVPAFCRVERGARGLRFAPTVAPADASASPGEPLRAMAAAPAGVRRASIVAEGKLVLAAGTGVAFSISAPRMQVIHDRRPPGLDIAIGAPGANAGLLRSDGGWRAVVLPSLGDVAADLGPGPVAIRGDGRRIAVVADGAIEEHDLRSDDGIAARHETSADALAYTAGGTLVVAVGSRVGPPGVSAGPGSPVVELVAAAAASRLAALHADGTVTVWDVGVDEPVASWAAPVVTPGGLSLSPDGTLVALGTPDDPEPVAVLADAADGAQVRRIDGARVIACAPEAGTIAVAGDWGCAWLSPPEEDR